MAARTAHKASSTRTSGMPNTASTASPTNFSTVPPCRSMASREVAKYRDMTPRSASGSSCSPRAVEPVTSQKSKVTTLRISTPEAETNGAPQDRQDRAEASICW